MVPVKIQASAAEQQRFEAQSSDMADEVARLRAELTAALSMGGGGAHMDVMSVVMGRQGDDLHSLRQ